MAIGIVNRVDSNRHRRLQRAAKVALRTPGAGDRHARTGLHGPIEPSKASSTFRVRLARPHTTPTAPERRAASWLEHPAPARAPQSSTWVGKALRRYCSGCARETEHVLWPSRKPASIPTIRWPVTEPAADNTICQDCHQLRAAAYRPIPAVWSQWPRTSGDEQGSAADHVAGRHEVRLEPAPHDRISNRGAARGRGELDNGRA
jgi:hypothetical protein